MPDQKLSQLTAATTPLSGTELVYVVQGGNSRKATAQDIADKVPGTDLSYDAATRTVSSSTGDDAVLPLATDAQDGLMSAAQRLLTQALIGAGVQVSGTAVVLPHIHGDLAGSVYIHVKNTSGGQLTKGTPVRVTGAVGDTTTLEVAAADSASAGMMPAIGILADTLAVNASGHATVAGELTGLNTAGLSIGQALYVAAGGGWTGTRPTTGTVQQVAIVGRVNAATGSVTATIGSGVHPVAYSGAYGDLSGRPTVPAAADAAPQPLGTAAIGNSADYAREDHVHAMPSAANVGADPAGTASAALGGHVGAADPHAQYALESSLGDSATRNVGTAAGTVAAGDDPRMASALYAVNNWIAPIDGVYAAGNSVPANTICLIPFYVYREITFNSIAVRVAVAAASSVFDFAIYQSSQGNATGLPIAVASGMTGSVATVVSGNVSPTTLMPNTIYFAAIHSASIIAYQAATAASSVFSSILGAPNVLVVSQSATSLTWHYRLTFTYGTWPDLTGVALSLTPGNTYAVPFLLVSALP